ncbi:MAG: hypothetical protein K2X86_16035 [Cytophagaceae bacterium]|nr:hypothetical protein [Cytophagaceae bacterium]
MKTHLANTGKEKEMPHYRTPMTTRLKCLCENGFDKEFEFIEDEGIKCIQTGEIFKQDDLKILERMRFEGISDPDDMAILYVVETNNGLKGAIVSAFGIYADANLIEFMNGIKDETIDNISESLKGPCSVDLDISDMKC